MSRLKYIMVCAMVTVAMLVVAQPVITFDVQRYDFGDVEEALGTVSCSFAFENTGNEQLVINKVRTSCGCTVPEYPSEPIAPGDKGVIKVTFNPSGRPGTFSKPVYVYSNTNPDRTILRIYGEVVQGRTQAPQEEYAYRIGDMAISALHMSLSKVVKGRVTTGEIEVVNVGREPLTPCAVGVPQHLQVRFEPDTLQHNERGKMLVTYNPDAIDDWGYRRDEFKVEGVVSKNTPESQSYYNTITVSGVLQEDFDSYTDEQREMAPILVVGKSKVDFKVVEGTARVSQDVYLFNAGKTPLTLHKVRCDNTLVKVRLKKNSIKPGQSTILTIELDPMRSQSNVVLSDIFIVSNDPTNPSQAIRITAEFK